MMMMMMMMVIIIIKTDGAEKQYSYIPPFNPNAKSAAEVYKLDDSILFVILTLQS